MLDSPDHGGDVEPVVWAIEVVVDALVAVITDDLERAGQSDKELMALAMGVLPAHLRTWDAEDREDSLNREWDGTSDLGCDK